MCYPLNQGLSRLSPETFFSEVRKAVLKHPDSGWSPLWSRAHNTCLISQNSTHGVKRETQRQGAESLLDVGSSPHELAGLTKLTRRCARECDTTGDWKGWGRENMNGRLSQNESQPALYSRRPWRVFYKLKNQNTPKLTQWLSENLGKVSCTWNTWWSTVLPKTSWGWLWASMVPWAPNLLGLICSRCNVESQEDLVTSLGTWLALWVSVFFSMLSASQVLMFTKKGLPKGAHIKILWEQKHV